MLRSMSGTPMRRSRTISDSESTEPPDIVCVEETVQHHASRDNLNALNAIVLCSLWCSISVINNIISKTLLTAFPYPLTTTLSQLVATALCAEPVNRIWDIPPIHWNKISNKYILVMIIPLGFGKFFAACGTHISISKLPVSYAHTVKATMPIFVVLLSTIFFGERYSIWVFCSLFVIFFGVGIASITELSFNMTGLISALVATLAFALLNILTKRCLNTTHMHQFRLLLLLARIASVVFLPIWIYNDLFHFLMTKRTITELPTWQTVVLLVSDGVLNFGQNLIAFTLIAKVTAVSYAVANVVKRIAVIVISILFFGNPVTSVNILGTLLAILGVFLYNMVKNYRIKTDPLLPLSHSTSEANLLEPNLPNGSVGVSDGSGAFFHHRHHHHVPPLAATGGRGAEFPGHAMLRPVPEMVQIEGPPRVESGPGDPSNPYKSYSMNIP